jgi:hypothetical protein
MSLSLLFEAPQPPARVASALRHLDKEQERLWLREVVAVATIMVDKHQHCYC